MTNDITLTLAEYDLRRGSSLPDVQDTVVLCDVAGVPRRVRDIYIGSDLLLPFHVRIENDHTYRFPSTARITVSKQSY